MELEELKEGNNYCLSLSDYSLYVKIMKIKIEEIEILILDPTVDQSEITSVDKKDITNIREWEHESRDIKSRYKYIKWTNRYK